ncbi:MAG: hypothetical protein KY461_08430, partial [Actinobacteria bacterium]|nr:hypothetical protein [Actinomycetota bacterium]
MRQRLVHDELAVELRDVDRLGCATSEELAPPGRVDAELPSPGSPAAREVRCRNAAATNPSTLT